jgi:AraC family transcriptional regulator
MELRDRFLEAIDYIEDRLLEPVRLTEVAERVGLSSPYFSRLFRVLTGEPFGSYVRGRRMTIAAARLSDPEDSVELVELAWICQYDSQEAFTRAFRRTFGVPPGSYRKQPPRTRASWRSRIDAEALEHLQEVVSVEPEIREIASFVVVGIRERFGPESKHHIPELWDRFLPLIGNIPHVSTTGSYGVCLNSDTDEGSFDYIAGNAVECVDTLPEGLIAETIPRQTYAVFKHRMKTHSLHEELQPTTAWIWGTWLPASPYEYAPGPDFEAYPAGFEPAPGNSIEICIPIQPRT